MKKKETFCIFYATSYLCQVKSPFFGVCTDFGSLIERHCDAHKRMVLKECRLGYSRSCEMELKTEQEAIKALLYLLNVNQAALGWKEVTEEDIQKHPAYRRIKKFFADKKGE